jgi:osmotically inducible lipoprotein OsmB
MFVGCVDASVKHGAKSSMTGATTYLPAAALLGFALIGGCGHNMEQRAATGAATGLVVAGPVGAAVGAGVGAAVNEADEEADENK